ncbi:hypothetical protein DNHGIG_02490 [Collibacillus ludicampi]|jgi:sorbitol-specific phosphotransferase system component IIA|uniref:Lipoprotein n=1 Tax=Collibacillus ludicampi TaxID=2771369 RepID=A0AAV4LAB8_9BACL|nr:hypothetical protein [Collibacillus ludicampi]GIM44700.1 hypothetical protein DNHGIG_02490 [Collibacillus ludicampi]
MKRKLLIAGVSIALLGFGLTGCGNTDTKQTDTTQATATEKDKAADVVKQFLDTQAKITYKDPASFKAGDKFLTPETAKTYNEERSAMYKYFTSAKITMNGSPVTVTFIKQEGNKYIFEGKTTLTLHSDNDNKSQGNITIDNDFTVSKEANGGFLISEIKNHGAK